MAAFLHYTNYTFEKGGLMGSLFAKEILDLLQGSSLLQLLGNPGELRETIVALESVIELLKDNERRLYPEQAPKSGRSRRNEVAIDINDPSWQRDKILKIFQKAHQPFTPAQLHGQYIKNVDATLLEARCEELVGLGELVAINSKRGDGKKYCLLLDVPPEPEPEPEKPKPHKLLGRLQLGGREVGIYVVVQGYLDDKEGDKDRTPAYLVNGDADLARCYKDDSDRLMDVPRNVVVPMTSKDCNVVSKWMKSANYQLPFPAQLIFPVQFGQ